MGPSGQSPSGATDVEYRRRLHAARLGLAAIAFILFAGTVGYMLVEGWSLVDSLYMVILTLSTVGFQEVRPLGTGGRVLTMGLILTGASAFLYVAAMFSRLAIEGDLRRVVGRRRMDKEISRIANHYIICGFGRVGREACRHLLADGVPVLVVDINEQALGDLAAGIPHLRGDAVEESVLRAAGIERAAGLLLTLSHEADNVYVTLLARDICSGLQIIARSVTEQGERRLLAAGADRVVSPERIGARSMSNSVTRPHTVDFTEVVTTSHGLDLQLEELSIATGSVLIGKSIQECNVRGDFGVIVVGILNIEGDIVFAPAPEYRLEAGSTLIILGKRDDVTRFARSA
ncbi:MAG TPA: potassium channel protein [Acidobacteriota bacterium]|nr:potassium channel protein [Acidobacteriota bacterium]